MKAETQAGGVLSAILASTRLRVALLAGSRASLERAAAQAPPGRPFAAALRGPGGGVAIIAEVKKRSPSAGAIREGADAADLAGRYAGAGAAAVSVLTEPERFAGSLDDLARVAAAVRVPVLRKDFLIDPIQLYEARAAGASAVLLIVRALGAERLGAMAALARRIGLEVLVEAHTGAELAAALAVGPDAVGINARDLESLAVDRAAAEALVPRVPPGTVAVAESGLSSRADVERVAACGADAVLVGTALAGAGDPGAALRALTGVPRRGREGMSAA